MQFTPAAVTHAGAIYLINVADNEPLAATNTSMSRVTSFVYEDG